VAQVEALAVKISLLRETDLSSGYAFHQQHAGEYLWPRAGDDFAPLAANRQLFASRTRSCIGVGSGGGRDAYVNYDPDVVIAHVHEFNDAPRRLLTEQLGLEASMRRNDRGQVVGDLFRHQAASRPPSPWTSRIWDGSRTPHSSVPRARGLIRTSAPRQMPRSAPSP
jgi:hypothetical protein